MAFNKQAPKWGAIGIEPPESKRSIGWEVEDRPPAAWLNWFMNLTAESLQELQSKAAEKTYVEDKIVEAIAGIDLDIPDASLTVKGITQLNSAVNSTSETEAATPKAVKSVNDAVDAHLVDDASLTTKGHAQLSSAVNSTSEVLAATPKAVKAAYDEAVLAKQAGNERKAEVVAALVAKGIPATTSETWAQLITKLTNLVKATGNAILADVLAGKGFSNATGNGLVGTMPYHTGVVLASGTAQWGDGGLAVYQPAGYYGPQGTSEIKVTLAQLMAVEVDLVASSLRSDKNIFGLQGSIPIRNASNDGAGGNHHIPSAISAWDGNFFVKPTPGPPIIYEGDVWLKVTDPDFVPRNIRSGVDMFGIVGTMPATSILKLNYLKTFRQPTDNGVTEAIIVIPPLTSFFNMSGDNWEQSNALYMSGNVQSGSWVTVSLRDANNVSIDMGQASDGNTSYFMLNFYIDVATKKGTRTYQGGNGFVTAPLQSVLSTMDFTRPLSIVVTAYAISGANGSNGYSCDVNLRGFMSYA